MVGKKHKTNRQYEKNHRIQRPAASLGAAYVSPVCKLVGAGRNTAVLSVPFEYSPGTPESPAGEVSSFGKAAVRHYSNPIQVF